MTYLAPAAQQLIREVQHLRPNAKATPVGPSDGIGFLRSVAFDAATTKWLLPMLEAIEDERLTTITTDKKATVINFVADTRADHETPYGLATVDEILNG